MAQIMKRIINTIHQGEKALLLAPPTLVQDVMHYKTLEVSVDIQDSTFQASTLQNSKHRTIINSIKEKLREGGGPKAVDRHLKQGKLLIKDRLRLLLDADSQFFDLCNLAGLGMPYGDIPNASVVAGIGKVHGRYTMILANDGTVKGGTIFPISLRKQLRCQRIAEDLSLPCTYLVDSGGAFLPLQADIFLEGGRTFYNEAIMSSLGIPQVAVVCGMCTAGGAYVPTMADEAVIVHKTGTVYLGGPPLVKAATGEIVSTEDLGGATMHCSVSGCTDHFARDEPHAYEICRHVIESLNLPQAELPLNSSEPIYNQDNLEGLVSPGCQDAHQLIGHLTDSSQFHEFKAMFGKELVTGFSYISGRMVGIVANNADSMSTDSAVKASHFVQLCNQRALPIAFLLNMKESDSPTGEFIKAQAQLMATVSCSRVPKVTVITGLMQGFSALAMGSKSLGSNFVFNWPGSRLAAAGDNEIMDEIAASFPEGEGREKAEERARRSTSALHAVGNTWTDGIILPTQTRQVLSQCLDIFAFSTRMKRHIAEHAVNQTMIRM